MMNLVTAVLAISMQAKSAPLLMAHYLPWYEAPYASGKWGWHWTMNHFNPDNVTAGRREAASPYRPLIGLYDSSDPNVIEYQVLLMKIAGLDGAIIDWYGDQDYYDYLNNDRNSAKVVEMLIKARMKFAILYEDQTATQMVKGGKFTAEQAVDNAKGVMERLEKRWFGNPAYAKIDGRPAFFVFGPQYYKEGDWPTILGGLKSNPAFFTLMFKRGPAVGAFSWPTPQKGNDYSWTELDMFNQRAKDFRYRVDVAYPRFKDIYREAGIGGFPEIEDRNGQTYRDTFARALGAATQMIQIATWNDWGEGTQIEPSVEFGYRDLEETQRIRKQLDPQFGYVAADLRLASLLLELRRAHEGDPSKQRSLDRAFDLLVSGKVSEAQLLLK